MTSTVGFSYKNRHAIQYPNIPSALRPVPRNESLPILVAPKAYTFQPEIYLEDFEPQPRPSTTTDDDEELKDEIELKMLSDSNNGNCL